MKSETEKQETTKVSEVKSIRFDYDQTTWELPFQTRLISESLTNLVRSETWSPKGSPPPLPTNYGPKGPLAPTAHPDIPH